MRYADFPAFLVSAALYREETIEDAPVQYGGGGYEMKVPQVVDRECPQCGMTKWKITSGAYGGTIRQGFHELTYQCKNCEKSTLQIWVLWWRHDNGITKVMKGGQYPKLEITIPKEFAKALGDKRSLYLKGMTSRHSGYGIGALTYFRRLIEDTTDEMLDLLEEAMRTTKADPAAIETVQKAKGGTRFEDKVKIAAEVLPAHLKPGGINPFADLYALLSIGLHDLTDEQCCDIVDAMDRSLKFIYTQIKTHAEDAKAYEQAAKSIHDTVAKLKQGDSQ